MKIGIFDSGIGGLQILKSIVNQLPNYDYIYFGDTINMPYGSKSQEQIYEYTKQAVSYLFEQDAGLIIVACNTASTNALRRIQQEYLPQNYPDRKILGVIIPTAETTVDLNIKRVGIIATPSTVNSCVYIKEIQKLRPNIEVTQVAAPGLALNIELGDLAAAKIIFKDAVDFLIGHNVEAIVLGCTHYGTINELMPGIIPENIAIVNQNEVIPAKLKTYLTNHPEITNNLTENGNCQLFVSRLTDHIQSLAKNWFNADTKIEVIK